MVKLYFDAYKVQNNLDYINQAHTEMRRAVYNPGNINIPFEFKYSKELKKILDGNYTIMNDLLNDRNFLSKSLNKFGITIIDNVSNINDIK